VHLAQVRGAGEDVVVRIERIATETVAGAQLRPGVRQICIKPIAPLRDTARTSPALSASMTAHIQAMGTPKRRAASAM
jgi:hypothetical protein